jgi:heptosyltransferase-2
VHAIKGNIAVVLPNHLGDVTMATPALRALRLARPQARITAVIRRELAGLLGGCGRVDQIVAHDVYAAGWLRGVWRRLIVGFGLRGHDLVLVLPNSWSGALLARLSGAPLRLGYARRGRGFLLTDALAAPSEGGRFLPTAMEASYLALTRALGCPAAGVELELALEPQAEHECDQLFAARGIDGARPLICLAPGAGYGPAKIWPIEYLGQVARGLLDEGNQVALVHAPGEEALAAETQAKTGPGLLSLGGGGMSLSLLKSVLARANLLICNDAGARHVATAFRVPVLVLMGPTSIRYTNLNLERTRILREPVDCSPCQLKVCPTDHRCMRRLLPERVLEEARAALQDPDWRGDAGRELLSREGLREGSR